MARQPTTPSWPPGATNPPPSITVAGWRQLAASKRAVATQMVDDRQHCRQAWVACGFAVEYAMKAAIMNRGGFNQWPDKQRRPDLWVHDLRTLFDALGIDQSTLPRELRAKLKTAFDWDRAHDYDPTPMPRRQARTMYEATFGAGGVIEWLTSL